jgi:hypothetical protein
LAQVIGSQKRHSEVSMGASDNDSTEASESTYCLSEKLAKTDFFGCEAVKKYANYLIRGIDKRSVGGQGK